MEREIKVKGTGSRCLLEECVKDNYYARFQLTESVEHEMKVKGTGSRCLLQECVKDKYYARFHLHSYHCCREMNFISRLEVNFLDLTKNFDKVSGA